MKKLIVIVGFILCAELKGADPLVIIYNDSVLNIGPGVRVQGGAIVDVAGAPPVDSVILKEDGSALLKEDGGKLLNE